MGRPTHSLTHRRSFAPWRCGALSLLGVLLAASSLFAGGVLDLVIEEDFEGGLPAGVGVVNSGAGNVQVIDDGSGGNMVLSLTQNIGNQGGWVWFPDEFDIKNSRVEVEFDLFLGRGASAVPADGMAVIFQFDGDLGAIGDIGGDLGVGNLRSAAGTVYEYIAVGFDIWDNGAADRETPCDGVHGPQSTCDVEVIQNEADPFNTVPPATGQPPDYIASADIYGSPDPILNSGDETFDPDDLIHVRIIFDAGFMQVIMRGGVLDGASYEEQVVIDYLTMPFPDRPAIIGFSASTGGANAWQWIDNLVVLEGDSRVTLVSEPPFTAGAINSAGPEVDTSGELDLLFLADRALGGEVSRKGDLETGITLTTASFGRVPTGADFTNANLRAIDVSGVAGAGVETAKLFINDAWSTIGVRYQGIVDPGRYEVTLYWSENFPGARNGLGQGTKLYDVLLGDEKVLCNWSAAAAAGSPTGSGNPFAVCTATLDTAVARTFSVDVGDTGDGTGLLDVLVADLGNGNPPENAALNALSFRRTGDTTGEPASGDLECIEKEPADPPPGTLIAEEFDDDEPLECPPGMVCNGNNYTPQVVDGRLRLTDDAIGGTATTAIFEQTVNVCEFALEAEFDLFMSNPDGLGDPAAGGLEAADGAAFFVMEGTNTAVLGPAGGSMGIPVNAYGFAVEFDTWNNGPGVNDPSGFNDAANRWTHVGINNLGITSVVTNVQYDPALRPIAFGGDGWPNFFDIDGVHVSISYNAGHVAVTLEGTTAEGEAFGPTVVVEADVVPIFSTEAIVGFAGGTGGRTQHTELSGVTIDAAEGEPAPSDPVAQAIEDALERWNASRGELFINCGGPLLSCSAGQFPAPGATGDASTGNPVVWLPDLAGGGSLAPFEGEFFSVAPLANNDGSNSGLQVAGTNMGYWDARGTDPGVDDNDRIFHTERWADHQYEIPVENATYEVTLYFANSFSGTAGTARRFFHVELEGEPQDGFEHCPNSGRGVFGPFENPLVGFDTLYDPVGHAESLYSADPCNFAPCGDNGVGVRDDPDMDQIPAQEECGNAAAAALRFEVDVSDGSLSIALTEPDVFSGEPPSPDMNPKISGISVRRPGGVTGPTFVRGDVDASGVINITDAVFLLNFLFAGGPTPSCIDAADADGAGANLPNITDAVFLLNWLFQGGPEPPAPAPGTAVYSRDACGEDPDGDADGMTCDGFAPCA